MTRKKFMLFIISLIATLVLAACSSGKGNDNSKEMDHSEMNHSSSSELPNGIQEAENPTYKVGSTAIINADHMEGMNGADATIVGAYDTTVYSVSYTPTTGEEKVTNHKWVVHEELENAKEQPYKTGDEVTLAAGHIEDVKGVLATIASAEQTTVYVVDYAPTNGGDKVTNHKWVTESEISPSE